MDWNPTTMLDKEEVSHSRFRLFHISMEDYRQLCNSYGHDSIKAVLHRVSNGLPVHRWADRREGGVLHSIAVISTQRQMRRHWAKRASWASKAFETESGLLRDSLWFTSLKADTEGLDGVLTVGLMVHHWGVENAVDFSHRSSITTLLSLLSSDIDTSLADALISPQES